MKSVIAAFVVLAGIQAQATSLRLNDTTILKPGSAAITSVAGKIASVSALCPAGVTCIAGGTILNLTFTGGCLDQFISPAYTVVGDEVIVHAQVVQNEQSRVARCVAQPIFPTRLQLINVYPPFTVRFLNTPHVLEVK